MLLLLLLLLLLAMQSVDMGPIHHFRHPIEIDQQAEKHLIGGGTVLEDAIEVAEYGNTRNILAVESEHTRGLRTQTGRTIGWRDMSVDVLVIHVIRGGDFGEKTGHHFNHVGDGHGANLKHVARSLVLKERLANESLDVGQVANFQPTGRCHNGAGEGAHGSARRA